MPIKLQPVVRPRYSRPSSGVFTSGDWNWVAQQDYNPDRAWTQIGTNRRGTVRGGPTYTRLLQLGNEEQWAVVPPRPALNQPVLDDEKDFYRRQLGALDLNLADPITTLRSAADQAGMATGEDQNPLSWLRDIDAFLQTKDIDAFGTGDTGAPARAADYALAMPILVWNHLTGRGDFRKDPSGVADFSYRFQADPRYWAILHNDKTTSAELDLLARSMVGQFADPDRNGYLVETIRKQFDIDKAASLALTSGNEAIDYAAIKFAANSARAGHPFYSTGMGEGWRPLPVIGTQIASSVNPITAEERQWWASLEPKVRAQWLQDAGMQQVAMDFVGSVPALSGLGTVLMVSKAGQLGTVGRALYQTYDWGFRGANVVMTTGLVVATTNWALEAYWPGYEDAVGREIDLTRPISGSNLAGVVNAIGYWSTGTYGGWNAVKGGSKIIRATAGKGLPILKRIHPSPITGTGPELDLYRTGHGGARMAGSLVSAGLDPQGLSLSQKRLTLSYVSHLVAKHDEEMFSSIIEGQPTGIDAIDELPLNERIEFANAYMATSVNERAARTEMAFRILNLANQPDELFKSLDDIRVRNWVRANARTIDHLSGGAYLSEYGPGWILRTTGGNDSRSMERWVRDSFARMGIDDHNLPTYSTSEWEQALRTVYHYEFDRNVGLMHAAIDAMPTSEASQISLVSARHVFKDEVEDLVAILRGESDDDARALVTSLIRDKIEVEQWFSRHWEPPRKSTLSPELVDPKALAKYLEEIEPALPSRRGNPNVDPVAASLPLNSFHRQLQEDGIWEIAFKPQDENGNFVSYVRTSEGNAFRSPWLDYPMTSTDMVELGNAGLLRSKWDAVFRGFRTSRISEFQRGSLFRNLTGNFDFTATQIDEFHDRVIRAAREFSVQPQTLGTVGKTNVAGVGAGYKAAVDRIAESVFGQGPYLNRRGEKVDVDWLDVIAKSYRQSLKLNLTAGLTSHMKSRLGSIGNGAAWASDIAYVNVRFNLSPIFKWSEFIESLGFGTMRGASRGDPWTEALFYRYGLGNDYGIVGAEKTYDQMLAGMNEVGRGGQRVELTPAQRQAKGYMWYARNLPEDFRATAERSMVQEDVAQRQSDLREIADLQSEWSTLVDEQGQWLPGAEERGQEIMDRIAELETEPLDLGPIATGDRDELMRQLRQTLTERPQPNAQERLENELDFMVDDTGEFLPGMEQRGNEILEELARMDAEEMLGPKWDWDNLDAPEQQQAINDMIAEGYVFHGSSRHPAQPGRINAEAGFFTTDSFPDAAWYASRLGDGAEVRARPKGTVYVTKLPPPERIINLRSPRPEQVDAIKAQVLEDAGFVPEWAADGWPIDWSSSNLTRDQQREARLKGSEYAKWVAAVQRWNPEMKGQYTLERLLYEVAISRSMYERAMAGGTGWGTDYLNDFMKRLGIDAVQVQEPPMLGEGKYGTGERMIDVWIFQARPKTRAIEDVYRDRLVAEQQSADRLEDVFGTPEHLAKNVETRTIELIPDWRSRLSVEGRRPRDVVNALLPNPIPFKERMASRMQIDIMRREFPSLLRASGMDGPIEVFNQLGIPEREWAGFLLRDRELLMAAQSSNHPDDWAALFDWAPGQREELDALYASEEWGVITSLWSIASRTASDDAFRVHFFNPYRSAFERSINHPVLGVYPASWAYKAAREWTKFLFDNDTFAGLHLGMTPVVAINNVVDAQNQAFAQADPEKLEYYVNRRGPFGSSLFIFNLLMPGDWSSIPFPLSRSIRDILRGNTDPGFILQQQVGNMGLTRDVRLIDEMLGEINDYAFGPPAFSEDNPWSPKSDTTLYSEPRR